VADLRREDVIDLYERALRIDITLDEAERLWPDPPQDAELAAIRKDLLFGLEHVPGSRRHPDGDPERWRQMPEYDDIERHVRRLRARGSRYATIWELNERFHVEKLWPAPLTR
jgi:hypothetical protein